MIKDIPLLMSRPVEKKPALSITHGLNGPFADTAPLPVGEMISHLTSEGPSGVPVHHTFSLSKEVACQLPFKRITSVESSAFQCAQEPTRVAVPVGKSNK